MATDLAMQTWWQASAVPGSTSRYLHQKQVFGTHVMLIELVTPARQSFFLIREKDEGDVTYYGPFVPVNNDPNTVQGTC